MAQEQSSKNCYPSGYSPKGWVRADQYIIELVCEKKAKTLKKELPIKFWSNPEWEKFFKSQLRKCKSLLQKYSSEAIIKALQDKRSWNIYSLFAPWLEDVIKEYQTTLDTPQVKQDLPEIVSSNEFKTRPKRSKSLIDRLEDIE